MQNLRLLIISLVITLTVCHTLQHTILADNPRTIIQFDEYLTTYERSYETLSEYIERYKIFKDNLIRIERVSRQDPGAEYGITEFADMSEEEFRNVDTPKEYLKSERMEIPSSYDWRDSGAVTPVQNQGNCGSCWAFSAVANMEGQFKLKHGFLKKFSEQQLVQCDNVDDGCGGGWQETAFQYVEDTGGIMLESDYPYVGGTPKECQFDLYKVQATVKGFQFISQNETIMAEQLVSIGPLSIGVDASSFQFYKKGVSDPKLCSSSASSIDHAVLLVGYGNEADKKGNAQDYWLIKNSWGAKWGEEGYIKLIRGVGRCAVNKHVLTSFLN